MPVKRNSRIIPNIVSRIQDHVSAIMETFYHLGIGGIAMADFNRNTMSPAILNDECTPLFGHSEQRTGWDLKNARILPDDDSCVDSIAVPESVR